MNARRTILAFAVALFISGVLTWSINHASTKPVSVGPRSPSHILVAGRDITAGEVLTAENVALIDWEAQQVLPGAMTNAGSAIGHVALMPLLSGEPILARKLADSTSGAGITATIPQGMRAITLRGSDIVNASNFVNPGTLVDVLATPRPGGNEGRGSAIVLQAVRVFATGERTSPLNPHEPSDKDSVTLLVAPSQVPDLNLAIAGGRIILAIRNGMDTGREMYPAGSPSPMQPVASPTASLNRGQRDSKPHAPASDSFTVETVVAGKVTSQSFEGERP